jgi:hypothetical protein
MPPLFECDNFKFHTTTKQAEKFVDRLSDHDWARFASACKLMAIALKSGQNPAGRVQRVSGSSSGLFEIKITPPGAKGPALRMLCVVQGSEVLCVRGVDKRQGQLPAREIKLADKAVAIRREVEGDLPGGQEGGAKH